MQDKNLYQQELFTNRLKKKYKELRKWARKNKIYCYRLYDKDIPEIPLSLDLYEFLPDGIDSKLEAVRYHTNLNDRLSQNDLSAEKESSLNRFAVLYLYERPYEKDPAEEEQWLNLMAKGAADVLGINELHIIKKERKQQKGLDQYEKSNTAVNLTGLTTEQNQLFKINLTSYLDTGLFFDHRPLRSKVREISSGKKVLNLFCYTGSFSVYAAEGNASYVESVDLSNTYLAWAKENMALNNFTDSKKYQFTRADVINFLEETAKENKKKYDLIILDPPTFSNSKNTFNVLDINQDYPKLIENALNILEPGGILYFSTNSTRLKFDVNLIPKTTKNGKAVMITDITTESIPKDFEGTKCHRAWELKTAK